METVSVGCRLPNGLRIEVGFTVSDKGEGGAPFAMYRKLPSYGSHLLRGTNQQLLVRDQTRKVVAMLPNQRDREPYINHNVPKDIWDRWYKLNDKSWFITSGNIFLVPKTDSSTVKAVTLDNAAKSKPIFEPIDPSQTMKLENHEISRVPKETEE